jgi:hypothetical protein
MEFYWHKKGCTGLFGLVLDNSCIHFLVKPNYWIWGYSKSWFDGPLHMLGAGPLFYAVWQYG